MPKRAARLLCTLSLLVWSLLLAACDLMPQGKPATPVSGGTSGTPAVVSVNNGNVAPRQPEPGPTPPPARPPSSLKKIADAEKAGKIDHDHALLYQVYAAVGDSKLPADLQGDDTGTAEEPPLLEIAAGLDQMAPDVQTDLKPFFLRPDNPNSYWYKLNSQPTSGKVPGLAAPPADGPVYAVLGTTQHFKVWYVPAYGEANKHAAEVVLQWAEDIWGKETNVMGKDHQPVSDSGLDGDGGGPETDIYVCHTAALKAGEQWGGLTVPMTSASKCPCPTYILVSDKDNSFDTMMHKHVDTDTWTKGTAAHEIFHAFQFAFPGNNDRAGEWWWWEASATWAEHYCYPSDDSEQLFAFDWFAWYGPFSLLDYGGDHSPQYSNYMWPFYLDQQSGNGAGLVGKIWNDVSSTGKTPLEVMKTDIPDFDKRFNEYAMWGFDDVRGPSDKFRDHGHRIDNQRHAVHGWQETTAPPVDKDQGVDLPIGRVEDDPSQTLAPAQITYYIISGRDPDARQLRFDWGDVSGAGVQVQALTKKRGEDDYQPLRDWAQRKFYTFCFNNPDDDVDYIVLVITNPNIKDPANGNIKMREDVNACELGNGTLEYSERMNTSTSGTLEGAGTSKLTRESAENLNSTLHVSFDRREDDDRQTAYYVVTGTNHLSVSGSAQGEESGKGFFPVGDASGNDTFSAQLSGSATTHNPPQPGDQYYKYEKDAVDKANAENGPDEHTDLQDMLQDYTGFVETWVENGQGHYRFSSGLIAPFLPQYTWVNNSKATIKDTIISLDPPKVGDCSASGTTQYDNSTGETKKSSTSTCGQPDNETTKGEPIYEGFFNVYNRQENGVDRGFEGTYDIKTGIIDASDTFNSSDCTVLDKIDDGPFIAYSNQLVSSLSLIGMFGDKQQCNVSYTAHLHIQLPGSK